MAGNIGHPSLYCLNACEGDSSSIFVGMPAVKLCDGSGCRRRMFSFVREVTQAVPAATSTDIWAAYERPGINLGEALIRA